MGFWALETWPWWIVTLPINPFAFATQHASQLSIPYHVPLHSSSINSNVEETLNWTAVFPSLFIFLFAFAKLMPAVQYLGASKPFSKGPLERTSARFYEDTKSCSASCNAKSSSLARLAGWFALLLRGRPLLPLCKKNNNILKGITITWCTYWCWIDKNLLTNRQRMASADPRLKYLRIKAGVVKRYWCYPVTY